MKLGLSKIILEEFEKKGTCTLEDLFIIASQIIEINDDAKIKHNIRAAIYNLKEQGKIERIGEATYKKT